MVTSPPEAPRQLDYLAAGALIISALILFGAQSYHPYSYYQLLRWVVSLSSVLGAWRFAIHGWYVATALLVLVAILFNPISPIYMHRYQWQPYDSWSAVSCAILAVLLILVTLRQLAPIHEQK
jgi:hypothetical protein